MNNEIVVSVLCITWNQAEYIRCALDGIVMQQTDFTYEVIVHDDASTDGTAEIVREYAETYPAMIRPLYETDNQYSKGRSLIQIVLPHIRGQYVALCEGDDYWCDAHKLQKQVNIMRSQRNALACVHNVWKWDCLSHRKTRFHTKEDDGVLTVENIIHWDDTGYATVSLMVKRDWLTIPPEFQITGVGDYPRAIYMALHGEIYYLKDCMGVYRCNANGSWTNRMADDIWRFRLYILDMNRMLQYVDRYSNGEFHLSIENKIRMNSYCLVYREMMNGSKKEDYINAWKMLTGPERIKVYVMAHLRPYINYFRMLLQRLVSKREEI